SRSYLAKSPLSTAIHGTIADPEIELYATRSGVGALLAACSEDEIRIEMAPIMNAMKDIFIPLWGQPPVVARPIVQFEGRHRGLPLHFVIDDERKPAFSLMEFLCPS